MWQRREPTTPEPLFPAVAFIIISELGFRFDDTEFYTDLVDYLVHCRNIIDQSDYPSRLQHSDYEAMQYTRGDLELWDMSDLIENSPLAALTADFERFKRRFASLFEGENADVSRPVGERSSPWQRSRRETSPLLSQINEGVSEEKVNSSSQYIPNTDLTVKKSAKRPDSLPVIPHIRACTHQTNGHTNASHSRPALSRRQSSVHIRNSLSDAYDEIDYSERLSYSTQVEITTDNASATRLCNRKPLTVHPHSAFEVYPAQQREYQNRSEHAAHRPSTPVDYSHLQATHRGTHRFIPRHKDEMSIDIGDPIHVVHEADDLWCFGVNLRTQEVGNFPEVYATDLKFYESPEPAEDESVEVKPQSQVFQAHFLGSMEVAYHRGSDVLIDSIQKIILNRRLSKDQSAPPLCQLDISEKGIKMVDITHRRRAKKLSNDLTSDSASERLSKLLAFSRETKAVSNHFFSLHNISFCGYHPDNDRYFAFITKHPSARRFACHCFSSPHTTQPIVNAIGEAFNRYYCGYKSELGLVSEDIYME